MQPRDEIAAHTRITTGIDRTTPAQKRRVMSRSSSDGPVSAVTITGSRAIRRWGLVPRNRLADLGVLGQVSSTDSPSLGVCPCPGSVACPARPAARSEAMAGVLAGVGEELALAAG